LIPFQIICHRDPQILGLDREESPGFHGILSIVTLVSFWSSPCFFTFAILWSGRRCPTLEGTVVDTFFSLSIPFTQTLLSNNQRFLFGSLLTVVLFSMAVGLSSHISFQLHRGISSICFPDLGFHFSI
jgi:hypothetical protein